MKSIAIISALTLVLVACAPGEDEVGTDTAIMPTETAAAETSPPALGTQVTANEFVEKAAADGMMEVRLGEMAQQRAQSEEVKQFGQMMVQDHSQANDRLKAIAQPMNLTVPAQLPADKQQTVDRLASLRGPEFDREYMRTMVDDHQKAVDLFQRAATSAIDPQLQSFAQSTLPTLQQHLDRAQQISGTLQ